MFIESAHVYWIRLLLNEVYGLVEFNCRITELDTEYDTKQSDGEAPVMLELWGMESTTLLPSPPASL